MLKQLQDVLKVKVKKILILFVTDYDRFSICVAILQEFYPLYYLLT